MKTFPRARSTVPLCYLCQRRLYLSVGVEPEFVYQVVQPLAGEVGLQLAEDSFDRVELWRVAHVIHR